MKIVFSLTKVQYFIFHRGFLLLMIYWSLLCRFHGGRTKGQCETNKVGYSCGSFVSVSIFRSRDLSLLKRGEERKKEDVVVVDLLCILEGKNSFRCRPFNNLTNLLRLFHYNQILLR